MLFSGFTCESFLYFSVNCMYAFTRCGYIFYRHDTCEIGSHFRRIYFVCFLPTSPMVSQSFHHLVIRELGAIEEHSRQRYSHMSWQMLIDFQQVLLHCLPSVANLDGVFAFLRTATEPSRCIPWQYGAMYLVGLSVHP